MDTRFISFCCCVLLLVRGTSSFRDPDVNTRDICQRDPPDIDIDSVAGDHGFRIDILGHAVKYTPGQVYTVVINGSDVNQELVGFMLVAVPINAQDESTTMGTFQHIDPRATRFVSNCPHVVSEFRRQPKSYIELLWTAPATGAGCVEFRATVIEQGDLWFRDDGALTKVLCEDTRTTEGQRPAELVPDCCACGTAKYEITFEGKWNHLSHPKDYPTHRRLLHWANIVGASHSRQYMVWQYGGYATRGVKEVCELGYPRTVEDEIQQNGRHVRSLIKTTGIWWSEPHGINQVRTARFSTDRRRHLMSLLTMLGPSPDWCVGVSALDMCLSNCTWAGDTTIDLYPWDAGTDDGITYMSPNAKSDPQQKIHRITNRFPNDPQSPFYGPEPLRPVATLTIRRLNANEGAPPTAGSECTDNADQEQIIAETGDGATGGLTEMEKQKLMMMQQQDAGKCAMTPWNDWSGCSVTCGVGQRTRRRSYLNPMVDESMCGLPVAEVENCIGLENECETVDEDCAVTGWSTWSPCSATCEKGTRQRLRYYLNKDDMVRCNRSTEETEMCVAEIMDCEQARAMAETVATCSLPFSTGPCRGSFPRWYYDATTRQCVQFSYGGCRGNRNRFESLAECQQVCGTAMQTTTTTTTTTTTQAAQRAAAVPSGHRICSLPMEVGPCRASFDSWYFDTQMQKCLPFTYGGCGGNGNRFTTMDQCTEVCAREPADNNNRAAVTVAQAHNIGRRVCLLPMEVGPCRASIDSWYFDTQMQKCLPFTYGGCGGNGNRFTTMDQCTEACASEPADNNRAAVTVAQAHNIGRRVCLLPMEVGPCRASFDSWYFDTQMQKCLPFTYGGCGGNGNRFTTMDQCTEACAREPADNNNRAAVTVAQAHNIDRRVCLLPMEVGPCRASVDSWYFDTQMQKCLPFTYGGCGGNGNRFATMDQCTEACAREPADNNRAAVTPSLQTHNNNREVCSLPMVVGPCRAAIDSWYYDTAMQKCLPFTYGGCRGNDNRFTTEELCFNACVVDSPANRITTLQTFDFNRPTTSTTPSSRPVRPVATTTTRSPRSPRPIHCQVTTWSSWSECSATCGNTRPLRTRRREVRRPESNGGHRCPQVLEQRQQCDAVGPCPVNGCVLSPWSDWSPCSKTCGNDAVQQRERRMIPVDPSVTCSSSIRMLRRICSQLPPCSPSVARTRSQIYI